MNTAGGALSFQAVLDNEEFKRRIDETERKIRGLSNSSVNETGKMDSAFKRLAGLGAGFIAFESFRRLGSEIINVRGEFQQLEVAFTTMLKSKEKANALMADIVDLAAKTPFTLQDVAGGAKQLLAYGFAAKDMTDNIKMLGNVAAGVSAPLGELIYLYGTSKTQGRLFTKDIMQFAGRGIPIIGELSNILKVAEKDVMKLVEEGKVGFPELEQVMKNLTSSSGMFYNLMEEQSKTVTGRISNLKDAWSQMLNEIGQNSEGAINQGIQGVSWLIENYEAIGKILLELVTIYGVYKAAIAVNIAILKIQQEMQLQAALAGKALSTWEAFHAVVLSKLSVAQQAVNKAMMANPYVAIASVIMGLVATIAIFAKRNEDLIDISEKHAEVVQKTNDKIDEETAKTNVLIDTIKNEKLSRDERMKALKDLQEASGGYLNSLTLENAATAEGQRLMVAYNNELRKKITLEANKEEIQNYTTNILKLQRVMSGNLALTKQDAEKTAKALNEAFGINVDANMVKKGLNTVVAESKKASDEMRKASMQGYGGGSAMSYQSLDETANIQGNVSKLIKDYENGLAILQNESLKLTDVTVKGTGEAAKSYNTVNQEISKTEEEIRKLTEERGKLNSNDKKGITEYNQKIAEQEKKLKSLKGEAKTGESSEPAGKIEYWKEVIKKAEQAKQALKPEDKDYAAKVKKFTDEIQAAIYKIEDIELKDKTFDEVLEYRREQYENYYQHIKFYGQQSADDQFSRLIANGGTYLEFLENQYAKLQAVTNKTPTQKDQLIQLDVAIQAEKDPEKAIEKFRTELAATERQSKSLTEYLEKLRQKQQEIAGDISVTGIAKKEALQQQIDEANGKLSKQFDEILSEAETFETRYNSIIAEGQRQRDEINKAQTSGKITPQQAEVQIKLVDQSQDSKLKDLEKSIIDRTIVYQREVGSIANVAQSQMETYFKEVEALVKDPAFDAKRNEILSAISQARSTIDAKGIEATQDWSGYISQLDGLLIGTGEQADELRIKIGSTVTSLSQLRGIEGKTIDIKSNAKEVQASLELIDEKAQIEGAVEINSNTSEMLNALNRINKTAISDKDFTVTTNSDEALKFVDDLNKVLELKGHITMTDDLQVEFDKLEALRDKLVLSGVVRMKPDFVELNTALSLLDEKKDVTKEVALTSNIADITDGLKYLENFEVTEKEIQVTASTDQVKTELATVAEGSTIEGEVTITTNAGQVSEQIKEIQGSKIDDKSFDVKVESGPAKSDIESLKESGDIEATVTITTNADQVSQDISDIQQEKIQDKVFTITATDAGAKKLLEDIGGLLNIEGSLKMSDDLKASFDRIKELKNQAEITGNLTLTSEGITQLQSDLAKIQNEAQIQGVVTVKVEDKEALDLLTEIRELTIPEKIVEISSDPTKLYATINKIDRLIQMEGSVTMTPELEVVFAALKRLRDQLTLLGTVTITPEIKGAQSAISTLTVAANIQGSLSVSPQVKDAQAALNTLNGTDLEEKVLEVRTDNAKITDLVNTIDQAMQLEGSVEVTAETTAAFSKLKELREKLLSIKDTNITVETDQLTNVIGQLNEKLPTEKQITFTAEGKNIYSTIATIDAMLQMKGSLNVKPDDPTNALFDQLQTIKDQLVMKGSLTVDADLSAIQTNVDNLQKGITGLYVAGTGKKEQGDKTPQAEAEKRYTETLIQQYTQYVNAKKNLEEQYKNDLIRLQNEYSSTIDEKEKARITAAIVNRTKAYEKELADLELNLTDQSEYYQVYSEQIEALGRESVKERIKQLKKEREEAAKGGDENLGLIAEIDEKLRTANAALLTDTLHTAAFLMQSTADFAGIFNENIAQSISDVGQLTATLSDMFSQMKQGNDQGLIAMAQQVNGLMRNLIKKNTKEGSNQQRLALWLGGGIPGMIEAISMKQKETNVEEIIALNQQLAAHYEINAAIRQRTIDQAENNLATYNGLKAQMALIEQMNKGAEGDLANLMQQMGAALGQDNVSFDNLTALYNNGTLWEKGLNPIYEQITRLKEEIDGAGDSLRELQKKLIEVLTGTSADQLANSIANAFEQGKNSAYDFAQSFEDVMKNAMYEILKQKILQPLLDSFMVDMAAYTQNIINGTYAPGNRLRSGKFTEEAAFTEIEGKWMEITNTASSYLDVIEQITGLDLTGALSEGSLSGAVKGITEETASVIAGQMNAIRSGQSVGIKTMKDQLAYLAKIQTNTARAADYLETIERKMGGSNSLRGEGLLTG